MPTAQPRTPRSSLSGLLLSLALLLGCGDADPPGIEPVVRDSAGVVIQEFPERTLEHPASLRLAETPSVRIGVVEGEPEYQWARPVAGARLSNGGFAVLDQNPAEVRVFDDAGRFVRRIGGAGEGPGEFRSPVGLVALPGDTILVWDRGSLRLSWFSPEGLLVRERTLREPGGIRTLRRVALAPSGRVVALGAGTTVEELGNLGRVREVWQVVPIPAEGEAAGSVGAVPGTERAIRVQRSGTGEIVSIEVQGRWWWGEGFAWGSRHGVWTAERLSLEARHFDPDRGLDRIVRIPDAERPFTRSLIDSLHQVELDRVDDPELRVLWQADFALRDYPPSVPPVEAVFGDAAGRVWIGLTEPPPARLPSGELPAVRRWVVFEEDMPGEDGVRAGLLLSGVLTLPARSHPLWADGEGVLVVRTDEELDVPYVEWYRLGEG